MDLEQIWSTAQNAMLDPFKHTLYYIAPMLGAFSSGYTSINTSDTGIRNILPNGDSFIEEVETLRKCADLGREISLYTSLIHHFTSFGGGFSLTSPIIVIPYHLLQRPKIKGHFGDGLEQEALAKNIETLTDDETRFYITREIGHLKYNDAVLKTIAKVVIIAAILFLYTTSIGWIGTATIVVATLALHLAADRSYESTMDHFAVKVLGNAFKSRTKAVKAAISALEKQRLVNLQRRENNKFCQFYLTDRGNNLLDLKHQFLTTRIEKMKLILDKQD